MFGEETYEHSYCLVDKYGKPYATEEGQIPVYMPSAYAGVRIMEAYCYLQAYAETNDITFKEYDAISLVSDTHTEPIVDSSNHIYEPLILHSSKVFDGMNFAKPVRKLQTELGELMIQIKEVEKRLGKLSKLIGKEFEEPEKEKNDRNVEPVVEEKSENKLPMAKKAMQQFVEEYKAENYELEEADMELE